MEKRSVRLYPRMYTFEKLNHINPGITAIETTSVPEAATSAPNKSQIFQYAADIFNIAFTKH
ncbi:hypothetical protein [Paenibacillus sp. UASWS1643]|uniref:hypothetical protein n=1 Tax=Paenibacillus sp. UASWS1643 TaxID=2580422 RepID=UPI00123AE44C|nr:hypothetical protein [Paenibacillus sp. UASWS1643]KAA8752544.1 hypothetical protein FE296_14030 [Paenibacillus sp. UASWS1643]